MDEEKIPSCSNSALVFINAYVEIAIFIDIKVVKWLRSSVQFYEEFKNEKKKAKEN